MNEEKMIDVKGTLEKFVKPDEPELEQEEAIRKYEEVKDKKKKNNNDDESDENTEEQEHLKRVKRELLASLERVKKLAQDLFGQKEVAEKTKLRIEKATTGRNLQREINENSLNIENTVNQKERE